MANWEASNLLDYDSFDKESISGDDIIKMTEKRLNHNFKKIGVGNRSTQ